MKRENFCRGFAGRERYYNIGRKTERGRGRGRERERERER